LACSSPVWGMVKGGPGGENWACNLPTHGFSVRGLALFLLQQTIQ